jgi:hypothetical protein
MGTSHMFRKSITDQRNNIKIVRCLLGPSGKSTNLQVFITMQRLVDSISIATHMRNSTVSAVAMIQLSEQHAKVERGWCFPFYPTEVISSR